MLVYDFKCPKCQRISEEMVRNIDSEHICPACHVETVKLICAPGMIKTPFSGGRFVTK